MNLDNRICDTKRRVVIDDYEQESVAHEPLIEESKVNQDLTQLVSVSSGMRFELSRRFFISRGLALGDLGGAIYDVWLAISSYCRRIFNSLSLRTV